MKLGPLTFDQHKGMGQVPYNTNIGYFGFAVLMTPSQFSKLAAPRDFDNSNIDVIKTGIKDGQSIGSPFLSVFMDEGDDESVAKVTAHEGRTRMKAIHELWGDIPVLVHIIPTGGLRARDITVEMVSRFRMNAFPQQRFGKAITGPHFDPMVWLRGHWVSV